MPTLPETASFLPACMLPKRSHPFISRFRWTIWTRPVRFMAGCWAARKAAVPRSGIDYNLFGHQIVAHLKPRSGAERDVHHNAVDGHAVPVPHFGVVLTMPRWEGFAQRLREHGVHFEIEPYIRFKGEVGEQATMFFYDPAGNALEFKAFADMGQVFAK